MALNTRFVTGSDADIDAWNRAVLLGFQDPFPLSEDELRLRREKLQYDRARGVFEGDRCVATFTSFDQQLTVPGGALVDVNAVSAVSVTATHRRQGLLSQLMGADLAEAKERGALAATLIAAEYRIYGRFGYGPAASLADFTVKGLRSGLGSRWSAPEDGGSVAYIDGAEVRKIGPELHERFRRGQVGAIDRKPLWWEKFTGEVRFGHQTWEEPFYVLYRDGAGVPQGLVKYTTDKKWDGELPDNTLTVQELIATTTAAQRALWSFLVSIDWVTTLRGPNRGPDDLLPLLLPDARAAVLNGISDFLWLRPLDVPALLASRSYATTGDLVLEVHDPMGLAGGRFALSGSPEGAECAPTSRGADLTMGVGALGSLYLGETTATRLAGAGLLTEETPGAVSRANALLTTGARPWCPDGF
ncbi:GNAT family N-acetyltransferase [Streptomyces sp. NRRL F-2890]|uniref:GNAT family N-acetyltransferase n=1 Tax=Streptomyces sp. NRRL F-2890 TaxID=1463845 RepID=UPI0004C97B72|nr:GNAT family N-acetyltransferase [Streptomyces sp. NRRL F-2890]